MKEIEVKVLNINVKKVVKKLFDLGAKKVTGNIFMVEKMFDDKNRNIRKNDNLLRLRQEGKQVFLTYKYGKKITGKFRSAEELEINVSNFAQTEKMLELLGFKSYRVREKKRTSYCFKKVMVEVDTYPKIPTYLEFEGKEKDIKQVLKLLGIDLKQTTPITATEVIKNYGYNPDNLKF